jgi:hypothetical protein
VIAAFTLARSQHAIADLPRTLEFAAAHMNGPGANQVLEFGFSHEGARRPMLLLKAARKDETTRARDGLTPSKMRMRLQGGH